MQKQQSMYVHLHMYYILYLYNKVSEGKENVTQKIRENMFTGSYTIEKQPTYNRPQPVLFQGQLYSQAVGPNLLIVCTQVSEFTGSENCFMLLRHKDGEKKIKELSPLPDFIMTAFTQ